MKTLRRKLRRLWRRLWAWAVRAAWRRLAWPAALWLSGDWCLETLAARGHWWLDLGQPGRCVVKGRTQLVPCPLAWCYHARLN